jgi:hypothetical protein
MKTIRTYLSGCTWCNATGIIKDQYFRDNPCPVCNGSKIVIVTEVIEGDKVELIKIPE